MELVHYPDPRLSRVCEPVELNDEMRAFIAEMKEFMRTKLAWGNPVGLAAPQVGKNWRLFIAEGEVFINPEILWIPQKGWEDSIEGCFSLEPNTFYTVRRAYGITLRYQNENGEWVEKKFKQFKAKVIQHEFDHLEGKLCNHEHTTTTNSSRPEGEESILPV